MRGAIINKTFFILPVCFIFLLVFVENLCYNFFILSLKGILKAKGLIEYRPVAIPFCRFLSVVGRDFFMSENRLAVISIIVENRERSPQINALLSDFGNYIVGRMGIPYKEKNVAVLCVVIDAPAEIINTLTGRIGMLSGVAAKTVMSKR